MVRLYKIIGFPYRVDLCFVAHKLVIEIDEDGHPYYKNNQLWQKLIENLGFKLALGLDPDVEIAKIYNYFNELSVKLAVNSAEKSLKVKFVKELLSYMSSISKPLNYIKYFIDGVYSFKTKEKSKHIKKEISYYLK